MKLRTTLLFLLLCTANINVFSQQLRRGYMNTITLNFPTYFDIDHYPGVAIGLEYERFLDREGHFSATLAFERAWAGTNAHGDLRTGEVRANIQSKYFAPGFFYHPTGKNKDVDLGVGMRFPLGNVHWRYDAYYWNKPDTYPPPSTDFLAAALAQVNVAFHGPGHFVFATYLAGGPLISNGDTHGMLVQFGIKWGGRF